MTDLELDILSAIETYPGIRFQSMACVIPPATDKEITAATAGLMTAGRVRRNGDRLYPVAPVIDEDRDGMTLPQAVTLAAVVVAAFVVIGIVLAKFS